MKDSMFWIFLHNLQDKNKNNYLTKKDLEITAEYLKLSYGVVYGIAAYYSLFSSKVRTVNILKVYNSPVCKMKGDIFEEIISYLKEKGESITIEKCECLGHCKKAPLIMLNEK